MQTTVDLIERNDLNEIERRVLDRITEKAWLDLTCELVPAGQPEAENPLDPDEAPAREVGAAIFIGDKLRQMGFAVTFPTKREGRPNVVGILEGAGDGPSLILNDHLDTYPAGDWNAWTMTGGHPFRPTRHGDKLYARGTSDTRGNLACTLLAARAIREAGVKLRGTLKCVYTADEEKNGPDGSIFLLDECGLDADYTIVCEPTGWTKPDGKWGMGIAVANGGNFLVEIETHGVKTHIWRPDTGINAVAKMARLLTALETMTFTHTPARIAGGTRPMTALVRVQGGVKREMQFTPDVARAVIAVVGILPGMMPDSVMADVQAVLDAEVARDPELKATARPLSRRAVRRWHAWSRTRMRIPPRRSGGPISGCLATHRRSTARTPSTTPSALQSGDVPRLPSVLARTAGRRSTNTSTSASPSRRRKSSRSRFSTLSVQSHD